VDFTIKLKPDGTDETNAAADAIARVRDELEKTQKSKTKIDTRPRAVREAKEDRELDRAASKYQKDLIKYERDQEKSAQRQAAASAKKSAQESKDAEKRTAQDAKDAARKSAENDRRVANEQKLAARQSEIEKRKADAEQKVNARAESNREKDAARKTAQLKKQQEREDKEVERYVAKAQRDLIKYEKEKSKEEVRALAEKTKPQAGKSGSGDAKGSLSSAIAVKSVIAQQAVEALKFAAGFAKANFQLALGYQGGARLSMISAQASMNWRRLFVGTNPKPLLDALQRTSQLIDPRTFTGKTLGEFFVRSANGIFNFMAKAEPYVRLFFKGMLYGALQAEIAWLKLRIAIQPALNVLPSGIGLMTAFGAGALAVKASFGLMGAGIALGAVKAGGALLSFGRAALIATAPLLPYAAAIGAIALALGQAIELKKQWDENSAKQIKEKLKEDFDITTQAERDDAADKRNKSGKYYVDRTAKPTAPGAVPMPKGADKQAAAAGPPIGKNLGLGIVAGLEETKGKVASSARGLVQEAEKAAKDEAEIKSPAAKWRREIGRNLGEGAALGLDDSADRMDSAARAMMPGAPGIGIAGGRAGIVVQQMTVGPFYGVSAGDEQKMRRVARDVWDDFAEQFGALAS